MGFVMVAWAGIWQQIGVLLSRQRLFWIIHRISQRKIIVLIAVISPSQKPSAT
jgi:hypothetical protein